MRWFPQGKASKKCWQSLTPSLLSKNRMITSDNNNKLERNHLSFHLVPRWCRREGAAQTEIKCLNRACKILWLETTSKRKKKSNLSKISLTPMKTCKNLLIRIKNKIWLNKPQLLLHKNKLSHLQNINYLLRINNMMKIKYLVELNKKRLKSQLRKSRNKELNLKTTKTVHRSSASSLLGIVNKIALHRSLRWNPLPSWPVWT